MARILTVLVLVYGMNVRHPEYQHPFLLPYLQIWWSRHISLPTYLLVLPYVKVDVYTGSWFLSKQGRQSWCGRESDTGHTSQKINQFRQGTRWKKSFSQKDPTDENRQHTGTRTWDVMEQMARLASFGHHLPVLVLGKGSTLQPGPRREAAHKNSCSAGFHLAAANSNSPPIDRID